MTRIGNWVLGAPIRRGAFGEVWRASHVHNPHLKVALKRARLDGGAGDAVVRDSFKYEGDVLARLPEHPSLIRLKDQSGPNEPPWLAIELVDGDSLADRLRVGGRVSPDLAVRWGARIADGLAAAHAAGVLHLDLKPGNVAIAAATGIPKVLDWGVSEDRSIGPNPSRGGTPGYRSPEQAAGLSPAPGDDSWALGVLLARMVGESVPKEPFSGPVLVAGDDEQLTALVRDLTASSRELRPSPADAAERLRRMEAGSRSARVRWARARLGRSVLLATTCLGFRSPGEAALAEVPNPPTPASTADEGGTSQPPTPAPSVAPVAPPRPGPRPRPVTASVPPTASRELSAITASLQVTGDPLEVWLVRDGRRVEVPAPAGTYEVHARFSEGKEVVERHLIALEPGDIKPVRCSSAQQHCVW